MDRLEFLQASEVGMGGRDYNKELTLKDAGDEVTLSLSTLTDGQVLRRNGDIIDTVPIAGGGGVLFFPLPFVGLGTGATKTTTVTDGPTIAEEFSGIGRELYSDWSFTAEVDRTKDLTVTLHFYLNSSEVGKLISFDLAAGASNGTPVNAINGTVSAADVPVSAQWVDAHAVFVLDAATYLSAVGQEGLHLRFTRVASSDEPVAHPRCHSLTVEAISL